MICPKKVHSLQLKVFAMFHNATLCVLFTCMLIVPGVVSGPIDVSLQQSMYLSPSLLLSTSSNCVYQIAVEMLTGMYMALLVRPIAPTGVSLGRASRCSFRPVSACVDLSFSKANLVIVFLLVTVQGKMPRRSVKSVATNHLVTFPVAYCESMRQISI